LVESRSLRDNPQNNKYTPSYSRSSQYRSSSVSRFEKEDLKASKSPDLYSNSEINQSLLKANDLQKEIDFLSSQFEEHQNNYNQYEEKTRMNNHIINRILTNVDDILSQRQYVYDKLSMSGTHTTPLASSLKNVTLPGSNSYSYS
jgi:hypothetical protein